MVLAPPSSQDIVVHASDGQYDSYAMLQAHKSEQKKAEVWL